MGVLARAGRLNREALSGHPRKGSMTSLLPPRRDATAVLGYVPVPERVLSNPRHAPSLRRVPTAAMVPNLIDIQRPCGYRAVPQADDKRFPCPCTKPKVPHRLPGAGPSSYSRGLRVRSYPHDVDLVLDEPVEERHVADCEPVGARHGLVFVGSLVTGTPDREPVGAVPVDRPIGRGGRAGPLVARHRSGGRGWSSSLCSVTGLALLMSVRELHPLVSH